ncbi:MAG: HU family DNA-binding protein [Candidatus Azobacteroides sp.]|nr:HU family DNA-binding protein [Candidatus Azobacteroides sp.]
MAIHYTVQEKLNPLDRDAAPKHYLVAKSLTHVDRKMLIKDMVRHTSLTVQEASTAIEYLFESIPRYLELGMTVQLGELGYFKVTLQSLGMVKEEDSTPSTLKSIHMKFIPGKEIRERVNNFPLQKWKE